MERSLTKFASDTKLCGAVTWEGRDVIHRDLDILQSWACLNVMKFNKAKFKVLCLGCGNPRHSYRLNKVIESSLEEKDLGWWLMKPTTSWTLSKDM